MNRLALVTARHPSQVALLMQQQHWSDDDITWIVTLKAKAVQDFAARTQSLFRSLAPKLFRERIVEE